MDDNMMRYTLRMDRELFRKFRYIADYYGRSANREIEQYVKRRVAEYEEKFSNPYCAAARGYVDMVIEPEQTRYYLVKSLDSLISKKESRPGKKHGNVPL